MLQETEVQSIVTCHTAGAMCSSYLYHSWTNQASTPPLTRCRNVRQLLTDQHIKCQVTQLYTYIQVLVLDNLGCPSESLVKLSWGGQKRAGRKGGCWKASRRQFATDNPFLSGSVCFEAPNFSCDTDSHPPVRSLA